MLEFPRMVKRKEVLVLISEQSRRDARNLDDLMERWRLRKEIGQQEEDIIQNYRFPSSFAEALKTRTQLNGELRIIELALSGFIIKHSKSTNKYSPRRKKLIQLKEGVLESKKQLKEYFFAFGIENHGDIRAKLERYMESGNTRFSTFAEELTLIVEEFSTRENLTSEDLKRSNELTDHLVHQLAIKRLLESET